MYGHASVEENTELYFTVINYCIKVTAFLPYLSHLGRQGECICGSSSGSVGPSGPLGFPGRQGLPGSQGRAGDPGLKGDKGSQGPQVRTHA